MLIDALGIRPALGLIGIMAPLGALASWRALRFLDRWVRARDADVALLQRVPMLRPLPEVTIEQLAAGLTRAELPAGAFVFEQGDHGDEFFVIERGQADVIGTGTRPARSDRATASARSHCFVDAGVPRPCAR